MMERKLYILSRKYFLFKIINPKSGIDLTLHIPHFNEIASEASIRLTISFRVL